MQINFAFCMTILNCWYRTTENGQISWGISFHTNASTSVAVTNGTSFSFVRTCSYLMLHYIKVPNLFLYDLDWLFKLKIYWVAEESERLICEIYTKTKFYKIYVVQQLLTNILSKTKKVTAVLEIFSFWQWLIEYSVVLILTSLTWCSIFYFLFIVQHLSTFNTVFDFSGLNIVGSSLTFSVLFLLFCYFNILFYSWHCVYLLYTVYTIQTS